MITAPLSLSEDYWETLTIEDTDLEFLYNYLLEIETPQTPDELTRALVNGRIKEEKLAFSARQNETGTIYLPKNQYHPDQTLLFSELNYRSANVLTVRPGQNPALPPFQVIEVEFNDGEKRSYATNLEEHNLNQQPSTEITDPSMDVELILEQYSEILLNQLSNILHDNPDLVRIAGRWFPRALLVDVNIGHLNLAEALLDMEAGGPLPTSAILENIELPTDVNMNLTEFSLNLALQEDKRFDDVGSSGEVMWFLRRLEPAELQEPPIFLRYHAHNYDVSAVKQILEEMLADQVTDELESDKPLANGKEVTISLIFPHWRTGTIPLSGMVNKLFPSAYESPRVQFTFVDEGDNKRFSGWVARQSNCIYGLYEWYTQKGLIPGSLVHIKPSEKSGEVIIRANTRRPTKEWLRTVLVGSDGGIVFANLKQLVSASYDDRMAIAISDIEVLDKVWEEKIWSKKPLKDIVYSMMKELTKLNPQGHVHAHELYAAVNIIRRCPPGPILSILVEQPWATYFGDLYFHLSEGPREE